MVSNKHVGDEILCALRETHKHGLIDFSKLEKGTKIHITTKNSLYKMEVFDNNTALVQGGKRYSEPTEVRFRGSTWGTPMLWLSRIGYQMRMELFEPHTKKVVTTSSVQAATVFKDDWSYQMEWGD